MEVAWNLTGELASQIRILGRVRYEDVKSYCAGPDLVCRRNEQITHFTWDASVAELVKRLETVVREREAY